MSRLQSLLHGAEARAGSSGFVEIAVARLESGAKLYGDRWRTLGLEQLLGELMEEAADLGGWAVLALQSIELEASLAPDEHEDPSGSIYEIICAGAAAALAVPVAQDALARARAPQPGQVF